MMYTFSELINSFSIVNVFFIGLISILLWILHLTYRLISNYSQMKNIPGTWQPFSTLIRIPWLAPYLFFGSFQEIDNLMRTIGDPNTRTTRITLSKINVLFICEREMLKEVLVRKNHLFHKRPHLYKHFNTFGVNILSNLDGGEEWKKHHRVVSNAFGRRNLEHLTHVAVESVDLIRTSRWEKQMKKALESGEKGIVLETNSDFSDITLDVLGKAGFGLDFSIAYFDESNPEGKIFRKSLESMLSTGIVLNHLFEDLIPFLSPFLPLAHKYFGVDKSIENVSKKLDEIISTRKQEFEKMTNEKSSNNSFEHKSDLLTLMVEANMNIDAKDKLTDQEIKSDAYIFSLAGHETTSSSLQWTFYELAKNVLIQNKVKQEIDNYFGKGPNARKPFYDDFENLPYVTAVMLESLRLHPPIPSVYRTAKIDTTIGKYHIPKDTFVTLNIFSANRFENNYEKPFEFNPERFPINTKLQTNKLHDFSLTTFSMGSRKCIGYQFALLEMFSILCRIFQSFEFELLNDEENENDRVNESPGVTVRPKNLRLLMKARILNLSVTDAQTPTNKALVGGNLGGLADYSLNLVFIDALKTTRKYGLATSPWVELPSNQYNQDGWPIGYSAGTVVFTGLTAGTVNGTYYFQGDGQLTLSLVATADCKLVNFTYSGGKTTGYIVVGNTATQLMLGFSQPTNTTFQNLRLIRPGFTIQDADSQVFLPSFLNDIKDLKILRMMDWGSTNGNPITKWSERSKTTSASYTLGKGAPYEVMIALANLLNKEIWVNVPAMVNEDYIAQMAKLFNQNLKSTSVVYLEYSNEVWNSGFQQASYNWNYAENMVLVQNLTFLNYDNVNNKYTWGYRRVGYMAYRISEIFAAEFGASKRNSQFRVVLAGQGANPYILTQGIALIERLYGAPSKYLYAISSAPYFQIDNNYSGTMTVDDVIKELAYQLNRSPSVYAYPTYLCLSRYYGLKHIAYEGGPDTFGSYNVASKRTAQFDPRMKQLTIDFLTNWFSYGFDEFLWFTTSYGSFSTNYGTWAWAESMLDTVHPKKDGIYYMINNPNVPLNTTVFRSFVGGVQSTLSIPAIKHQLAGTYSTSYIGSATLGSIYYYPIIISKRGYYSVSVETQYVKQGGSLGIYWNNVKVGSIISDSKAFNFSIPIKTSIIEKGIAVVTLYAETDRAYNINTLNVTLVQEVADPIPTPTPPPQTSSTTNSNRTVAISGASILKNNSFTNMIMMIGLIVCSLIFIVSSSGKM